ncbi:MAG: hypothetical protein KKB25_02775, partial [Nanoarchaeota archaeon]|nr:hypothetical protein [Nanoarchaeota archaeon]
VYANLSLIEANFRNLTFYLYNSSLINSTTFADATRSINWTGLAEGIYYFNSTAIDPAGNINSTETRAQTLDRTVPFVRIILPENTTYNSVLRTLNYTASDTNLQTVWYQYDGTNVTLTGNITFNALDNQASALTLYANDSAGNINQTNITFTIDTLPPAGVTNLTNTSQGSTWIFYNWTNSSDTQYSEVRINGTFKTNTSEQYYNASQLASNSWYEIAVRSTDIHNNTNTTFENSSAKTSGGTDAAPPTIISHSITPKAAINGTSVSLQMEASDNYAVHTKWAIIVLPNGAQAMLILPATYATSASGRYNITFFANDTSNNTASVSDHFIAEPAATINITAGGYDSSALATNITIYYDGSAVNSSFSGGNYTFNLSDYVYDLDFAAFNSLLGVMMRGVNISYNQGRTILFDNPAVSGYLAAYAVNSTFNITGAQVTINYSSSGYSNEDYLGLYKCDGWNITERSCAGSWDSLSSAQRQNKTVKTIAANVTGFSGFAIKQEAVPAAAIITPSTGGGAAGGLSAETKKKIEEAKRKELIIDKESVKFKMIIGQTKIDTIRITNNGSEKMQIKLELKKLEKYATISKNDFALEPKEGKTISITAVAGENYGVFAGELVVSADITKTIPVILEVESAVRLFDAKVDITSEYKKVLPGQELKTQITLLSMGPVEKKIDVTIHYFIKNMNGEILAEQSETFAVERQKSFTKTFSIPSDAKPGNYIIAIEVLYGNSFAVSSDIFEVVGAGEAAVIPVGDYGLAISLLAISVILIGIAFWLYASKKDGNRYSHKQKYSYNPGGK